MWREPSTAKAVGLLAVLLVFLAGGPVECLPQDGSFPAEDAVVGEVAFRSADGVVTSPQDNNNHGALLEEEPTIALLEELLEQAPPAAAPPPPDPAALAAAEAAQEMGKKGDEKTDKKMNEEKRKHEKREAWRARQKKKLDDLKSEASTKIEKEAAQKADKLAEQDEFSSEVKDKKKQIKAQVEVIKKQALDKAAQLVAKNEQTKKRMEEELASIKSAAKENDEKVIGKVKASIAAQKAKQEAEMALTMAKVEKKEADEKAEVKKKFDDDGAALDKQYADARAARDAEVAAKAAAKDKLREKDSAYEDEMDSNDAAYATKLQKLEAKEVSKKARALAETQKEVERRQHETPGAKKVERLKRRQERETDQLGREVTRDSRREMHKATKRLNSMAKESKEAISSVLRSQLEALHEGAQHLQQEDAPAANHLLAQAWQLAVDDHAAPSNAQAEAVQVARGGSTDLVPGSEVTLATTAVQPTVLTAVDGAWRQAYGPHEPHAPQHAQRVSSQSRAAFAKALGIGAADRAKQRQTHEAEQKMQQAWASAIGGESQQGRAVTAKQLAQQALGFDVSEPAPPAELGDVDKAGVLQEELEVALAARQVQSKPSSKHADHAQRQQRSHSSWEAANPQASAEQAARLILDQEEHSHSYLHDVLLKRSHHAKRKSQTTQGRPTAPQVYHQHRPEAGSAALAEVRMQTHTTHVHREAVASKPSDSPVPSAATSESDVKPEVLVGTDESAASKSSATHVALPAAVAIAVLWISAFRA